VKSAKIGGDFPRDDATVKLSSDGIALIHRTTGWSLRVARTSIDVTIALAGILLGGPFGVGTIAFAFLVGPSVQAAFKLLKVKPHQEKEIGEIDEIKEAGK
jgi:uncharacterized membrane protein YczE